MTAVVDRRTPVRRPAPVLRRASWTAPTAVGLGAALVAVAFSWVPSVWYDEAATIVSATRSWSALGTEIRHVDVVHATYYSLMHVWFTVVGYTPFTLRLPSALAVGAAAALIVVLGRILANTRVGLVAGILFALFPRVTWMGAEGRSFALDTLLAVGATILFVTARDRVRTGRRSWPWWIAYTVVSILGGAMFLYLVLVTVGHGVSALLPLLRRRDRTRTAWTAAVSWAVAGALTLVGLLHLARASSAQSAQISWIQPISRHTVEEVLVTQFFDENPAFAVLGCVLAIGGALLALRNAGGRRLLVVALPWAAVPTLGLIVASLVTNPLYSPRYVAFAAPAAALCMGAALDVVPARFFRRVVAVTVIVAAGLTAPTWVQQRTVAAKDDSAWNQVAALITEQRATEPSGQDDAVVFGPLERHPLATSRIIEETYPAAFAGIRDPLLLTPASASPALWDSQRPLAQIGDLVGGADTVWLLTAVSPDDRSTVTKSLASAGYHVSGTWERTRTWIVRYTR